MNYSKIGETLRYLRESQGISIKDFAALSGFSHSRVCNIETCKESTSLKTLERYASALKMKISEILIENEVSEEPIKISDPIQTIREIQRLVKSWSVRK